MSVGLVLLLCISAAVAQELEGEQEITIDVDPVKDTISAGDTAVFDVTITNNLHYDDTFKISFSNDVEWTILTDPLKYKLSKVLIPSGESIDFLVKIRASPSAFLAYWL